MIWLDQEIEWVSDLCTGTGGTMTAQTKDGRQIYYGVRADVSEAQEARTVGELMLVLTSKGDWDLILTRQAEPESLKRFKYKGLQSL